MRALCKRPHGLATLPLLRRHHHLLTGTDRGTELLPAGSAHDAVRLRPSANQLRAVFARAIELTLEALVEA